LAYDLYAGAFKPKVHIHGLGYVKYDNAVTDHSTDLVITSFNPASGSSGGLCEVTVVGTGFPLTNMAGFVVKVGTVDVIDFSVID
jgi:hypothetical protein